MNDKKNKTLNKFTNFLVTFLLIAICVLYSYGFYEDLNEIFRFEKKWVDLVSIAGFMLMVPLIVMVKRSFIGRKFRKNTWYKSLVLAVIGGLAIFFKYLYVL